MFRRRTNRRSVKRTTPSPKLQSAFDLPFELGTVRRPHFDDGLTGRGYRFTSSATCQQIDIGASCQFADDAGTADFRIARE